MLCLVGLAGQLLLAETYSRVQQRGVPLSADNPVYFMVALASSFAVLWICAVTLKHGGLVIRSVLLGIQLVTATLSLLIFRMSVQERNPTRGNSALVILIAEGVIASVFVAGAVTTMVMSLRRRRDAFAGGTHPDARSGD